MFILYRCVCLLIGYLFGTIQPAFLIGKMKHIDIREHGSGNSGTTNAMRVLGKKVGAIVFFVDGFKAIIAITIVRFAFLGVVDYVFVLLMYTGLGVIIGHNFPFYMNFKGGKGIAASAGVILASFDYKLIILAAFTFIIAALITKYVSVGSLSVMTGFLIEIIIFGELGLMEKTTWFLHEYNIETYIVVFIMTVFAYIRHKENIKRLINGTERKMTVK